MDAIHLAGMVRCLGTQIASQTRSGLERYWRTRMALVWTVDQVHKAANERELVLSQTEAIQLLQQFHRQATPFHGLDWFGLITTIEESGLGRSSTRPELKRFLKQNRITRNR